MERDLLQPFGVCGHPEVSLAVGEGGVNLVGEAPSVPFQAIVEGAQGVAPTVEVGEAAAVGMYPQPAADVFVDMEGGARAVGAGCFYDDAFALQHAGAGVEVDDRARSVLLKPDLGCLIYIDRTDGRLRKEGGGKVFRRCRGGAMGEEAIGGGGEQQFAAAYAVDGDYGRGGIQVEERELPVLLLVAPDTAVARTEEYLLVPLQAGVEGLAALLARSAASEK